MTRNIFIAPCRISTLAYVLLLKNCKCLLLTVVGRDSVVGVTTHYELDSPGSNPDGARFSVLFQTGVGAHTDTCTLGTGGKADGK